MKNSLSLIFCLLLISGTMAAQDGQLDLSYHPNDRGRALGDGPDFDVYAITHQADGKIVIGGLFNYYNNVYGDHIARINSDGSIDSAFVHGGGFDGNVFSLEMQPDGRILAGGAFTTYSTRPVALLARLNTDGSLDTSFQGGKFNNTVFTTCLQPDGKILVGGAFTSFAGRAIGHIARLNTDGTLDTTFNAGGVGTDNYVRKIKINAAGEIFVVGYFAKYNTNTTAAKCIKLTPTGALDPAFTSGTGSGYILSIDILPSGKLIVGGDFNIYQNYPAQYIARLMPDGNIDFTFDTQAGFDSVVYDVKALPDGGVVAAGLFKSYQGVPGKGIYRLDSTAYPMTSPSVYDDNKPGIAYALDRQSDGKILLGGAFEWNGRQNLVRYNADYSSDEDFIKGNAFDRPIYDLDLRPDGKVTVGGEFISYDDVSARKVARLNADGSLDNTFHCKVGPTNRSGTYNDLVQCVATQPDGKTLVGGPFTYYDSLASQSIIVRLLGDGTRDTSYHPSGLNNAVYNIAAMADGRALIGGSFNRVTTTRYLVRLAPNGTPDTNWTPQYFANAYVNYSKIIGDGRIYTCGGFTKMGNLTQGIFNAHHLARLLTDGLLDTTFVTKVGADGDVYSLDLQADGKLIIGGDFRHYDSIAVRGIARINADGSLDTTFHTGAGTDTTVSIVRCLPSGKILAGGNFTAYAGHSATRIMRLNADGSFDNTFNAGSGANSIVQDIVPLPDGSALIAGNFTTYNGIGRNRIARIHNEDVTGITDIVNEDDIMLYPNPAHGLVHVDAGENIISEISISDLSGRIVRHELLSLPHMTVYTAGFAKGIYLVSVKTASGTAVKKLVVE